MQNAVTEMNLTFTTTCSPLEPMKKFVRLLPLMALCAGLAYADLASDLEDYRSQKANLDAEIKKLDVRIRSTDSLTKDEAKRTQQLQSRYSEDLRRRRDELDSMQGKMKRQAADLQAERNKQAAAQIASDNSKAYRSAIVAALANEAQRLEDLVATSVPYDREKRVERIQALRRDLQGGNASPEEGFSRLTALYGEEIRFGDEITIAERPMVRKSGETINARVLRIGNQWMVYSDDEGLRIGVLQRTLDAAGKLQYNWREDLSFEERQAVKLAIDVKLARKPPQMVSLPLTLSIAAPEAK